MTGIIHTVMPLSAGDPVPEFTAVTDSGSTVSTRDLRGHTTVLYFFSNADTPG